MPLWQAEVLLGEPLCLPFAGGGWKGRGERVGVLNSLEAALAWLILVPLQHIIPSGEEDAWLQRGAGSPHAMVLECPCLCGICVAPCLVEGSQLLQAQRPRGLQQRTVTLCSVTLGPNKGSQVPRLQGEGCTLRLLSPSMQSPFGCPSTGMCLPVCPGS